MTFLEHVVVVAVVAVPVFGLQTLWWARALKRIDRRLATIEDPST